MSTFGIKTPTVQAVASRSGALFETEAALHRAETQRAAGVIAGYATSYVNRMDAVRSGYDLQMGMGRSSDATHCDASKIADLAGTMCRSTAADAILYLADRIEAARGIQRDLEPQQKQALVAEVMKPRPRSKRA